VVRVIESAAETKSMRPSLHRWLWVWPFIALAFTGLRVAQIRADPGLFDWNGLDYAIYRAMVRIGSALPDQAPAHGRLEQ
jgi:hypothetical protein